MKILKKIAGIAMVFLIVSLSCQVMFTYSPFESFQRDPAKMTAAQQETYAEDILSTGTPEEMAEAFTLISALADASPSDADLQTLAANLAFGASGIETQMNEVITGVLADPPVAPDIEAILAALDVNMLQEGADYIAVASALDPSSVSSEEYINAAISIFVVAINGEPGHDPSTLTNTPAIDTALDYLTLAGLDAATITGMFGATGVVI